MCVCVCASQYEVCMYVCVHVYTYQKKIKLHDAELYILCIHAHTHMQTSIDIIMNMTIGNKIKPNLDKWQIFEQASKKEEERENGREIKRTRPANLVITKRL